MKNGLEIDKYGSKFYYENGYLHRLGGLPACEYANGSKDYYENGNFHRLGGLPAIEYADGDKRYYENDKLHRLDGPAVDYVNVHKEWWFNGKQFDCKTQEEFEKLMKLKAFW